MKCGSSWMSTLLWLLTHNLDYKTIETIERKNLMGNFDEFANPISAKERARKFLEEDASKTSSEATALTAAWNEIFNHLERPRIIKTHMPPFFLPKNIWSKGARIVYVSRNLKDMAVSLYHFLRNYYHADVTMDDVVNSIVNDICVFSPHLSHYQNFWQIKHMPNVLFHVKYEDLVNDSFETIKKVSEFLGCNYTNDQLNQLADYVSFEKMKNNKSVNRQSDVDRMEHFYGKQRPDTDFK